MIVCSLLFLSSTRPWLYSLCRVIKEDQQLCLIKEVRQLALRGQVGKVANREIKIGPARLSIRAPLRGRGGSALGLINSLAITDSALTAERLQMDVIANNTANANTTHTPQGGPYKREDVYLAPAQMESNGPGGIANAGVQVAAVVQDNRPPR